MADTRNTLYVAKESFTVEVDGEDFIVHAGSTMIRTGHPLLEEHAERFREVGVERDVEQATAAPGEKRG